MSASNKISIKKMLALPIISSCLPIFAFNFLPAKAELSISPWSKDVQYEVIRSAPDGAQPKAGDLVAIRFKGTYNGNPFDDTFSTADPYFYRFFYV
jgi:hypothetical protein